MRAARALTAVAVVLALVVGCSSGSEPDGSGGGDEPSATPTVPDGFEVTEVVAGLEGPTQLQVLDDGRWLVAQLGGQEGAPTGQVLLVDPDSGEREVLAEGLVTPTGVAAVGQELWVMERRALSRGPLDGGAREVVLDELPFNGRSQGTLTVLDDGRLLYDTSGDLDGEEVGEGSGTLWVLDPGAADPSPEPVAEGFKHAYAHTIGPEGTVWVTEVVDGAFDGGQAPDELVALPSTILTNDAGLADAGWPRCIGERVPVEDHGGTADGCADTIGPHVVFDEGATPTSVAVSPWDPDTLLVALWNEGEVVAVPRAGDAPVGAEPFLTGVEHPQHLVVDGDRLLVVDHTGGRILEVARQG